MARKRSLTVREVPPELSDCTIRVTSTHIRRALKGSFRNGPLTWAIRTGIFTRGWADSSRAYFEYDGDWWMGILPPEVRDFVMNFEDGRKVDEISFKFINIHVSSKPDTRLLVRYGAYKPGVDTL